MTAIVSMVATFIFSFSHCLDYMYGYAVYLQITHHSSQLREEEELDAAHAGIGRQSSDCQSAWTK